MTTGSRDPVVRSGPIGSHESVITGRDHRLGRAGGQQSRPVVVVVVVVVTSVVVVARVVVVAVKEIDCVT